MNYVRPQTIHEAISEIVAGGKPLAGGSVLVPDIMEGSIEDDVKIVDIGRIDSLHESKSKNGYLYLGAMTTLDQILSNVELKQNYTALYKSAEAVGNPQVRRVATVGGNLAVGVAIADLPPALLVHNAEAVLLGENGEKIESVGSVLMTGLSNGRLVTAIRLPTEQGNRSSFVKFAWRKASGKTIVNAAISLSITNGVITQPRLSVGGICQHAMRLREAEDLLNEKTPSDELVEQAARTASAEVVFNVPPPPGEEYRRRLVAAGVRQLLTEVIS